MMLNLVYPKDLKEKAMRLSMKMISSRWRDYKTRLRTMLRKGKNPFTTFKHLKEEDWKTFRIGKLLLPTITRRSSKCVARR